MSTGTTIAWTDATWNPLVGCSRVSEGCRHCYAERLVHRGLSPQHRGLTKLVGGEPRWTGEVRLVESALTLPLRWKKPRRVFVNSLSDLFHEAVPGETIAAIFGVMAAAPQHAFQVLTKRPARMADMLRWLTVDVIRGATLKIARRMIPGWSSLTLPNVWLGVSVEDQATADERIPLLLQTPAAVRFVSAEPLLGPVEIRREWWPLHVGRSDHFADGSRTPINWLIVGGESGPGARPCDLAWIRSLIAQCQAAGVPAFVKQLGSRPIGEWGPNPPTYHLTDTTVSPWRDSIEISRYKNGVWNLSDRKGGAMDEWPADLRVQDFPHA